MFSDPYFKVLGDKMPPEDYKKVGDGLARSVGLSNKWEAKVLTTFTEMCGPYTIQPVSRTVLRSVHRFVLRNVQCMIPLCIKNRTTKRTSLRTLQRTIFSSDTWRWQLHAECNT